MVTFNEKPSLWGHRTFSVAEAKQNIVYVGFGGKEGEEITTTVSVNISSS
jgi:hypothetical protein